MCQLLPNLLLAFVFEESIQKATHRTIAFLVLREHSAVLW